VRYWSYNENYVIAPFVLELIPYVNYILDGNSCKKIFLISICSVLKFLKYDLIIRTYFFPSHGN